MAEALNQVFREHWEEAWRTRLPVVTAGIKEGFLARKAALASGFSATISVDKLLGFKVSRVLPAAAAALMAAERMLGGVKIVGD